MELIRSRGVADAERNADRRGGFFAATGVIGALVASSCCIGPIVLLLLGVSGAWISNLTALEPYKLAFALVSIGFIGLGFRQVYFRPAPACAVGGCARPRSAVVTKTALYGATALVLASPTWDLWAPLLY